MGSEFAHLSPSTGGSVAIYASVFWTLEATSLSDEQRRGKLRHPIHPEGEEIRGLLICVKGAIGLDGKFPVENINPFVN